MAITMEIGPSGVRVIDTAKPSSAPVEIALGLTITKHSRKRISIADSTSNQAINFDGISAAQALVLVSDGAISVKVNGSATGIPVNPLHIAVDSAGGITAATISNASGTTRYVEVLIVG